MKAWAAESSQRNNDIMKTTLFALLMGATAAIAAHAADTKLWYDKPASIWMTEALPIGNGELGAMVFGMTDIERIQFNEKSLWYRGTDKNGAKIRLILSSTMVYASSCLAMIER
jgi:hypothetical protein